MTTPWMDRRRDAPARSADRSLRAYRDRARQLVASLLVAPLLLLSFGCSQTDEKAANKPVTTRTIEVSPITPVATGKHHPGRFVWHDLVTDDIETAKQFYGGVFGWTFETRGRYTTLFNHGKAIGGIIEVEFETGVSPFWVPYLSVANLDDAVGTAKKRGGELLRSGNMINRGRFALIGDTEGARVVLLHAETGDPAPAEPAVNGWLWDELWTGDVPGAVTFYQQLVPYQTLPTPANAPAEAENYKVMTVDDRWAAGVTTLPFEDMNAQWIPVLRVGHLGQAMAEADKLGGRVLIEPGHALTEGNIALLQDPSGAILMVDPWMPKAEADAASANTQGGGQ